MGHAVNTAVSHYAFQRFIVRRVGLHDLFYKCHTLHLFQFDLRHPVHEHTDKGIAVGVQPVRCKGQHRVPLFHDGAVNDPVLLHYAGNAGGEHIYPLFHHGRLYACLPSHQGTFILPAGIRYPFDQSTDGVFLRVSAHDRIQHGKRFCPHDSNVIDQMIYHIMADGVRVAILHGKLLF